ncbi:hypothetical protein HD554DRAFT_2024198 [Boletus coccyginus]|nr:hypothetical protein HD554DRAFT_2024198 [Boletus coccyginus]
MILSGNEQERFINNTGDIVKLPVVQLLCDVKTHWDSIYYMINYFYFLDALCNIDIADYNLGSLQWDVLQDMEVVLEAQQTMCGEIMQLLGGTFPSYETFLAQWTSLSSSCTHPQLAPFISEGLECTNKYHTCLGHSKAYLFTMCK